MVYESHAQSVRVEVWLRSVERLKFVSIAREVDGRLKAGFPASPVKGKGLFDIKEVIGR